VLPGQPGRQAREQCAHDFLPATLVDLNLERAPAHPSHHGSTGQDLSGNFTPGHGESELTRPCCGQTELVRRESPGPLEATPTPSHRHGPMVQEAPGEEKKLDRDGPGLCEGMEVLSFGVQRGGNHLGTIPVRYVQTPGS